MKLLVSFVLVFGVMATTGKVTTCPDKKTTCQSFETCVTWERGCSVGANCLEPGLEETQSDCVELDIITPPLLPSKQLCNFEEVFARSLDKMCPKYPCPIRISYNCYPDSGSRPTCAGVNCPAGMYCYIGESCSDILCEPKALCKTNL